MSRLGSIVVPQVSMQIVNVDKPSRFYIKSTIKPAPLYSIKAISLYGAFLRASELIAPQVNELCVNSREP